MSFPVATSLGAWALGFLLWEPSKRYIDPAVAAGITRRMRRKIDLVGVFVNQPLDEIAGLVDALNLTHVQLHGDEGPSFCQAVAQRTGAKVIKALRIAHASDLQDVERFHTEHAAASSNREMICQNPYDNLYASFAFYFFWPSFSRIEVDPARCSSYFCVPLAA